MQHLIHHHGQSARISPPFGLVTQVINTTPRYHGVPQAPKPRRCQQDLPWSRLQKKLEVAMHKLMQITNAEDIVPQAFRDSLFQTAALIRSGWEDCHQERRKILAGEWSAILGPRKDDDRPRLLTNAETNAISQARLERWRGGSQSQK